MRSRISRGRERNVGVEGDMAEDDESDILFPGELFREKGELYRIWEPLLKTLVESQFTILKKPLRLQKFNIHSLSHICTGIRSRFLNRLIFFLSYLSSFRNESSVEPSLLIHSWASRTHHCLLSKRVVVHQACMRHLLKCVSCDCSLVMTKGNGFLEMWYFGRLLKLLPWGL